VIAAYVDASSLLAIALEEPEGVGVAKRLAAVEEIYSSNLLEAEVRSALAREGVEGGDELLHRVRWVLPTRPLGPEIQRVLAAGYLRGSNLWHLATALYLAEQPSELPFLTLDARQRALADRLGFPA
jgi:predicted nucleic acid-binding protein